ncbi:dephospho-CoA kinase [Moraxella caviae]|uniref:Dephospho-CoA kinase n=1 Tax=Moraxella caviae TaxID=34060 RepID=A0A1T0A9E7_9GAMM|nr:dephospho-CoA kinase [Moraxella caviae]OOR92355.1 dephospho-CoA kinase [Moraxella caviae]STZ10580.1 Dephospho-CoA kinase [Moraxella caviae]VEW10967.1 Dephospho-CoA kinase [Moraxella caviae]
MTHPLTIGVTGGIGSGKTAVTDWFASQGIDVIDADVISRTIIKKGSALLASIRAEFGDWVLTAQGEYDRAAMRAHIVANPHAIARLNALTHPAIRDEIMAQLAASTSVYRILSVPLLVEGMAKSPNLAELCDRILVVNVSRQTQIERASRRDGQSVQAICAIIDKQATPQERLAVADDVVDNEGSLAQLYAALQPLHERYLALAKARLG